MTEPAVNPSNAAPAAPAAPASMYDARAADWRCGAVVYQVLPDRFAPPADLEARRAYYPPPKVLRRWDEPPRRGRYRPDLRLWSHEIDFWGGDLRGLTARLDHVRSLGADVLYLNPIHHAFTNHKYDALDHAAVSPELGTRADLRALADAVHARGMRLVLDGVFNHLGRQAPRFVQAAADPASPWRDWFHFDPQAPGGARAWRGAENLPELNLAHPAVREHLFAGPDAVVRQWLRDGADGWRLDVASDLGPEVLQALTQAVHDEKPGALVVGEIANYPAGWFPAVDAVMNFTLRQVVLRLADGRLPPRDAQAMIDRVVADTAIEPLLRSWLFLDNHDTPRLATRLPDARQRRLAQLLQFTLPGAPNLYYGSEVGMTGGDDPGMRAPMRWDLVAAGHPELDALRRLVALRRSQRALRIGDYRRIEAGRLLAFERHTDRVAETVVVLANPGPAPVSDTVLVANPMLMNGGRLIDLLGSDAAPECHAGVLEVTLPPCSAWLLQPVTAPGGGYTPYKNVR